MVSARKPSRFQCIDTFMANEPEKVGESQNVKMFSKCASFHSTSSLELHLKTKQHVTCRHFHAPSGMESVWEKETKSKLRSLFRDILDAADDADHYHSDDAQRPCITFTDFITYFSPHIRPHFNDEDTIGTNPYADRFEQWRAIKNAVRNSPLSARNRSLREKENISASKYREKLNDIEKLISLLEEGVIFDESKEIKLRAKAQSKGNHQQKGGGKGSECIFWRKKILKHREFVRFYQDVILQEVIAENHKMKSRIERLAKMNKFSRKMAAEEQEWFRKNEHLLHIEQEYYGVLKQQKQQQMTMKKVEKLVQQKDREIYRLKSQLMEMRKRVNAESAQRVQSERENRSLSAPGGVMNDKLLRLKGEIALKKLEIQKQLNVMTSNINEDTDRRDGHHEPKRG